MPSFGPTLTGFMLLAALARGAEERPHATPGAAAGTGAVIGTVNVEVVPESDPPDLGPYSRRRAVPPAPHQHGGGVEDAVIYLHPVDAPAPLLRDTVVRIVQRNRTILPYLTVVPVGARVEFPNRDRVFHNLFSLSEPNRFDLGRYAPGHTPVHVFDAPGTVRLFCDIHSEMAGVILVLDTPYFARADNAGEYRVEVPPGRYTVVAWHEGAASDSMQVDVPASGVVHADFSLRP